MPFPAVAVQQPLDLPQLPRYYTQRRNEIEPELKRHNRGLIATATCIREYQDDAPNDKWAIGNLTAERAAGAHLPIRVQLELQSLLPLMRVLVQDEDMYHETLLIDPDDCEHVLLSIPPEDDPVRLDCRFLPDRRPIRVLTTRGAFRPGSKYEESFQRASDARALQLSFRPALPVESDIINLFQRSLNGRASGRNGVLRNNWWISRHMDYREKAPAQRYMGFRSAVSAPDIPPWLATGEGRKYANSFSQQRISNPLFHSSKMLEDILQPALLWERKAEHYAYSDQFSARARFSATFHRTMRGKHFLIKIRIRGQSIQCGGEWVLPEDGCTAAVRVMEGAIIPTPVISPVLWSGKLRRAPGSFGCDLFMICEIPSQLARKNPAIPPGSHVTNRLRIRITSKDVATERKMAAVEKAAHFVSPLEHDVHQQTKLEWFSLRNVLFGGRGERGRQSPNFVTQFHNSSDLLSQEVDRIRNLVLNIIPRGLNLPQKNAYDSLLSGAPAALALVEGLPGAGKMECLTRFTYALALMNFRVLYVTEADAGAQVAASSFHQYSTVSGKGELNHAFVRLLHANAEALPDPCNASPQTNPETLLELDAVECLLDPVNAHAVLAARIEAFVTIPHNRNNQAVKDYLLYKNNFDKGLPAPRRKGLDAYSKVWSRLEQLIFRAHRVVFSTLTAAHGLYNRGFQADVVILDEASHTSTPAALQPLVDQEKIKLVVLAGDSHQLDPCVLSAARSTNPLANWLQISALDYSLAQPWNHRFRLNQNFRSHPDIVALTSELFYKKELVPDLTSVMHYADALTLTVQTALGSLYFNIFQQHDWRRCFFVDVPSLPEAEPNGASHANPGGINAILTMVRGLVAFGMSGDDIGIITMYRFDRDEMAAGLEHAGISSVECGTIDAFQGREQPIVILHFVAAFSPQGPFSFTRDRQRLCVALSRARRYLFVFGNLSYWEAHEGRWAYREKLMANFVNIVRRQQGPIVRVRYPQNRVDTVLTHRL